LLQLLGFHMAMEASYGLLCGLDLWGSG
jgi:hypothetical protein